MTEFHNMLIFVFLKMLYALTYHMIYVTELYWYDKLTNLYAVKDN
jgi:hypothetical protein